MGASVWTEARRKDVAKRYLEGQSAEMIAQALRSKAFQPSRNGVIGLLHRMGVTRPPASANPGLQAPKLPRVKAAPKPPKAKPPTSAAKAVVQKVAAVIGLPAAPAAPPRSRSSLLEPGPSAVSLVALPRNACKFPVGQATGSHQLFCGCVQAPGDDRYCEPHARLSVSRRAEAA